MDLHGFLIKKLWEWETYHSDEVPTVIIKAWIEEWQKYFENINELPY